MQVGIKINTVNLYSKRHLFNGANKKKFGDFCKWVYHWLKSFKNDEFKLLILKGENMKKLSKKITVNGAEQNALFNALKKACYHLANNTSNASENPDVREG